MPLFGKKQEKSSTPPLSNPLSAGSPTTVPVEQVISLRRQGISNSQIVEMLQRDGYKTHQIFDAMNQADLKAAVVSREVPQELGVKNPIPEFRPESAAQQPPLQTGFEDEDIYPQPEISGVELETAPPKGLKDEEIEKIEEISEAIINEKWNEFIINVNKIIAWKERTEARMKALEERFEDLRASFSELQKAMLGKIEEYDKHIIDVSTEIKAMEKTFQKVLPSFTANINELSRIVEDVRGVKRK